MQSREATNSNIPKGLRHSAQPRKLSGLGSESQIEINSDGVESNRGETVMQPPVGFMIFWTTCSAIATRLTGVGRRRKRRRVTQGCPEAFLGNPGLMDGIPLGFSATKISQLTAVLPVFFVLEFLLSIQQATDWGTNLHSASRHSSCL